MRRLLASTVTLLVAAGLCWAATANLEVRSHPDKLRVFIDGHCKGVTPLRLDLTVPGPGPREVQVQLSGEGLEDWVHPVALKPGDHKAVSAYLKRASAATAAPSQPAASLAVLKGKVICLDPGHPSETSGGTKGKQLSEQRADWLVALRLASLLEAQGARAVLTKKAEAEKVVNRHRAEIANAAGAQLLVRLHCDAAPKRGFAVYYPDRAGKKDGVSGPSRDILSRSHAAALRFHPAAAAVLGKSLPGRGLHGESATFVGGQQGALTSSIFAKVPVLTVQMVALNQPADEAFLRGEAGQDLMARALLAGIAAALTKPSGGHR